MCERRISAALQNAGQHYRRNQALSADLRRLVVVYASRDMACFADREEERLYTAVRGTNALSCRDLCNDVLIAAGYPPRRATTVLEEYRRVRLLYPDYQSFGCGHSLGGTVMHELAYTLEGDTELSFVRVDVFNAGGSPLRRRYTALDQTLFFSHRVDGDFVSRWYEPPGGQNLDYKGRRGQGAHFLTNFLPRRRASTIAQFFSKVLSGGFKDCDGCDSTELPQRCEDYREMPV